MNITVCTCDTDDGRHHSNFCDITLARESAYLADCEDFDKMKREQEEAV